MIYVSWLWIVFIFPLQAFLMQMLNETRQLLATFRVIKLPVQGQEAAASRHSNIFGNFRHMLQMLCGILIGKIIFANIFNCFITFCNCELLLCFAYYYKNTIYKFQQHIYRSQEKKTRENARTIALSGLYCL